MLISNPNFSLDHSKAAMEQQLQICFNIFPKGQSILHKLAQISKDSLNDQVKILNAAQTVFDLAKKGLKNH